MCSHVKKEVVIRTTEHSPFKVCRNTFGSNNLQWSFSIWLSQSLTSLWTNFGPLFFTALLRVIENCGHLFIHVDFKAFWWICWDVIFNTHLLLTRKFTKTSVFIEALTLAVDQLHLSILLIFICIFTLLLPLEAARLHLVLHRTAQSESVHDCSLSLTMDSHCKSWCS